MRLRGLAFASLLLSACAPSSSPSVDTGADAGLSAEAPILRAGAGTLRFSGGVRLSIEDASFGLDLVRIAYDTHVPALPAGVPTRRGDRVEVRRGVVLEWYRSVDDGFEHGLTIDGPCDGCADAASLTVAMRVVGATMQASPDGRGARLQAVHGNAALDVHHLSAVDARGRTLPATLRVEGDELRYVLDVRGAEYPLAIDPTYTIGETIVIPAPGSGDAFGDAFALSDTALIAGAPSTAGGAGAAYLMNHVGTKWSSVQKLAPSDLAADAHFGSSAAMTSTTALIGAPSTSTGTGAAYVFVGGAGGLTQQAKLASPSTGDRFGASVAISGDYAIVGAPNAGAGAAYVFERAPGGVTWTQRAELTVLGGTSSDGFGTGVAISGSVALVGAPGRHSAYAYSRSGAGTWSPLTSFTAPSTPTAPGGASGFGVAVAFDGTNAVILTPHNESFLATYGSSGFSPLTAMDVFSEGAAVATANGVIVIGQPNTDPFASGAGWGALYEIAGSTTTSSGVAFHGTSVRAFGNGVAISTGTLVIGGGGEAQIFRIGPRRDLGAACTDGSECKSFYCVDGVCCDSACSGTCKACSAAKKGAGADGTCAAIADGRDPDKECPGASCSGLTLVNPQVCNGSGACRANGTTSCPAGFSCIGTACAAACTTDGSCAPGYFCNATGTCVVQLDVGAACGRDRQCASGSCVEGVCCDKPCTGGCASCLASRKATGADGTCGAVRAGTDPRDACARDAGYPKSCRADGFCDGAGACRVFAPKDIACGPTSCTDGTATVRTCDGVGGCGSATRSCGLFACDATGSDCLAACSVEHDCADTAYCASGVCVDRKSNGTAATEAHECLSKITADGVCCDRPCGGPCEACDTADKKGTCVPVAGAPHHGTCPKDGPDACSARVCDGAIGALCAGFVTGIECRPGSCTGGVATAAEVCDGSGTCPRARVVSCGSYQCGPTACKDTCNADGDCVAPAICDVATHQCVSGSTCSDDRAFAISPDGSKQSCAPYRCEAGACISQCASTDDCADNFVCDSAAHLCIASPSAPADGSGGCSTTPGARGPASALALAVAVAWLARRRAAR